MEKHKFNPLDFLYNKEELNFEALFPKIKDRVSFTLLNCGTTVKEALGQLPLQRNESILYNIISLGMMDKYTKVLHNCQCKNKKQRRKHS